ncbi:hypothetical protein [Acetilactobacillus jinshanensis]|uniref:Uncharacterized protein n=1 Tax=Acetilactobacillus jinshanensis TaxID=1720083 RepID=A0A4P6ZK74_9LACO|nr:hypothetical protein [Acetilactobacillus jinshanensis]QBP17640.1 hypothetical protein ELX58_00220 [Acetilactobacillus jinshanensis]URL61817.1 hypothetical protein HGK75_07735 [uncultured bacterium]
MLKIIVTVVLVVILLIIIISSCHRAYKNGQIFKKMIDSSVIRDNVRFIMQRYHGSDKAIKMIQHKYMLSETMALRLIHKIGKRQKKDNQRSEKTI